MRMRSRHCTFNPDLDSSIQVLAAWIARSWIEPTCSTYTGAAGPVHRARVRVPYRAGLVLYATRRGGTRTPGAPAADPYRVQVCGSRYCTVAIATLRRNPAVSFVVLQAVGKFV